MPLLQKYLLNEGTLYSNHYCTVALCCPSRVNLWTGKAAHNTNVTDVWAPYGGYPKVVREGINDDYLPHWLQAAGYRTMHVGKFLNGYGRDAPPTVPPGFDDWNGFVDPSTYSYYSYTVDENGVLRTYPGVYSTDFVTQRARDLIAAAAPAAKPWFMSVAFLAPHSGAPRELDDPAGLQTPAVPPIAERPVIPGTSPRTRSGSSPRRCSPRTAGPRDGQGGAGHRPLRDVMADKV